MRRYLGILPALLLALCATCGFAGQSALSISSPAFANGGDIPSRFTCKGEDINPPLEIHGTPAAARTLVLILEDPDAPGGLFTHWMVWNINPSTAVIAAKSIPIVAATEGTNDFGKMGYRGPCPPSGTHRYVFRLFALDRKLDLPGGAKRAALKKAMLGHVIASGELTGRFAH